MAVCGLLAVLPITLVASQTAAASNSVTEQKVIHYVRERFGIPDTTKLTVAPFQDSQYSDFYKTTILVQKGKEKSAQQAFITKDGHYMVIGTVFNLNGDPHKEIEQTINLVNQPSVGPANARVTVVEFADLECPMCAETQKFIEHDLIPKYGNKIRIVFKEFPLVQIHHWALTAAIANECAYKLNPADFLRYRSTIFAGQDMINAANVRSLLLDFGQRSGLNRLKLADCIDSKATLPRVEADMREGEKLGIMSTPTLFINGSPVVGYNPNRVYQLINKDLQKAGDSK